jgi:MraZ protein
MFVGNYSNSADVKGRAMIPVKFRHRLGERCMLVKGFDACLYLYTEENWHAYKAAHIDNRPDEDPQVRNLKLFFYGNSRECEIDRQGRIIIPPDYMAHAGVEKEMVNIGFGDHIEIWGKEQYEALMASAEMNPKELFSGMQKYIAAP